MKKIVVSVFLLMTMLLAQTVTVLGEFVAGTPVKSALLMEASSGKVIYENNSHESLPPASVTKIMTMLLICEAIEEKTLSLDTIITASERAKSMGGSTIFLDTNEKMTLDDLMKGIAVASANDACVAVAEHMCGSVEAFVEKMNKRAAALGMKDTNFINCNGLDAENHHTSAYDIALMSRELLKHDIITRYTTIWMDSLRNGEFQLANTNKLIRFYSGANGLKTGSTSNAGCCISASAKRDDMQLIAVVLGAQNSKDRFNAAREMLDYGFSNFAVTSFGEKGTQVTQIPVINGKEASIMALTQKSSSVLIEKSKKDLIKTHINIPEEIPAPVKKGDVIGEMIVTLDGETLAKANLVADKTVKKKSGADYFIKLFSELFIS